MKSEFMMIDPNELVIDMPVDERNVESKMRSLQENGMIQPVTVWLNGLRIIDGFHRAVAAQRLGWKQMSSNVIDCTEEGFWDARIQSAKQHHEIADERLGAWMLESWKQSKWYLLKSDPQYAIFWGDKAPADARKMGRILWEGVSGYFGDFNPGDLQRAKLTQEQLELVEWIEQKANVWGISPHDLAGTVLEWVGIYSDRTLAFEYSMNNFAREHQLTLAQRQLVVQQTGGRFRESKPYKRGPDEDDIVAWVRDEVTVNPNNPEQVKPFRDYMIERAEQFQRERQEEEAREQAERERQQQQDRQYWDSPAGRAERARIHFEEVKSTINRAFAVLSSARWEMRDLPETPLLLAQHMEATRQIIVELFPDSQEAGEVNPIWLENIQLRKRIAQQAERISSLERALGSKQSIKELTNDTLAWSSIQIEQSS